MKGQRVWLTGASSGIGAALARELSRRGASLILSAPDVRNLQSVAAECPDSRILPLDLLDAGSFAGAVDEAWEAFGGVDVMIHNAGVAHRDLVRNTPIEIDRRLMQINYFGPVELTKLLLPRMLAAGGGRFVVTSSLSGKYGVPRTSAYAAAKHALHGFFDTLRTEEHPNGIAVTIVIPGFVATDITRHAATGTGAEFGRSLEVQQQGISAETCATAVADAIEHDREEVLIGGSEILSVYVDRLSPWLWRRIIRNHPMRHLRELSSFVRAPFHPTTSDS